MQHLVLASGEGTIHLCAVLWSAVLMSYVPHLLMSTKTSRKSPPLWQASTPPTTQLQLQLSNKNGYHFRLFQTPAPTMESTGCRQSMASASEVDPHAARNMLQNDFQHRARQDDLAHPPR